MKNFLILAFSALLLFCLFGCKAIEKYKASAAFPKDCADKYPVKIDTTFIEGKAVYDTIWNYETQTVTDTVINEQETTIYRDVIKKVTIRKVDTIILTKENTARVEQLIKEKEMDAKQIAVLEQYLKDSEGKRKRNGKQRNWMIAMALALTVWTFRKPLLKLIA